MTCEAMVLEAFGEPLRPRELEVPELGEGQVLVKLEASGVCGSDLHMARGRDPRTPLPMILGHEGMGRVERVRGRRRYVDGTPVREGDRVLW
ncbi:MAG: alcohol dehydrogenase, partial [Candidatus Latescibacterota bacterium]